MHVVQHFILMLHLLPGCCTYQDRFMYAAVAGLMA